MNENIRNSIFYSVLLALQFGLQPIISNKFINPLINKSMIVIVTESSKIIIAFLSILCFHSSLERKNIFQNWNIIESFRVAGLPAILYAIQNILIQYGYLYLNSLTFNLLNQTKTLSAALWLYILMGQIQSPMQIFALFLLLVAAVILNIPSTNGSQPELSDAENEMTHYGIIFVLLASMLSGVSAALTQRVLAGSGKQRNSFLLSAEMAAYGILFLIGKEILESLFMKEQQQQQQIELKFQQFKTLSISFLIESLFQNWNIYTFIPILTNACGGLIVGLVTKYAGGVIKGFALIAGLILTGVVQWLVNGTPLRVYDWIATLLVSISIILHTQFPAKVINKKIEKKKD